MNIPSAADLYGVVGCATTLPDTYSGAGVIPFNQDGLWLCHSKKGHSDFGGKRCSGDRTAWATASRELMEEGSLKLDAHTFTYAPEGVAKYVHFYAETSTPPTAAELRFVPWTELQATGLPTPLHPRLRFDKGGLIMKTLRKLAHERVGARRVVDLGPFAGLLANATCRTVERDA